MHFVKDSQVSVPMSVVATTTSEEYKKCKAYLKEYGATLDSNIFYSWFEAHQGDGEWLRVTDETDGTLLHIALRMNVPETVVTLLFRACTDAIFRNNPSHIAAV